MTEKGAQLGDLFRKGSVLTIHNQEAKRSPAVAVEARLSRPFDHSRAQAQPRCTGGSGLFDHVWDFANKYDT